MELRDLSFRPRIVDALNCSTFETVADVLSRDEEQLCGTLKISAKDAAELVQACVQVITCSLYPPKTALQLLKDAAHCMLSTGDTEIDKILGGGILSRGITEIVGESGTGKTQLCLQFCLTVQFPKELGEPYISLQMACFNRNDLIN
ncbi:hypothetical protein C2G38_2061412 [Gigaspora rosea]|uniref:RecA family profile 1 domain-containing protein n=1 Tax=Gigaspora rosea TaxID=44941 RepID=A0A397VYQ8_9GLOM|nr:hypothetical protein C2G38_2061412 [Gigaspora rosea]